MQQRPAMFWLGLFAYWCCFPLQAGCNGKTLSMRIVDEPTSYQWQQNTRGSAALLKPRVQPAPFSGPAHFSQLVNMCFQKEIGKYRYELCPFANVTQQEMGISWNLYSGILGVWCEWQIVDNHFTAMLMKSGDVCGGKDRSVDVKFACGESNVLHSVSEPVMCSYQLEFKTPLVCHPHSMLVYPAMPKPLKDAWNRLEGELQRDEITPKGYQRGLDDIFRQAGYFASAESESILRQATTSRAPMDLVSAGAKGNFMSAQAAVAIGLPLGGLVANGSTDRLEFKSLGECNAEYQALADELLRLRRDSRPPS